MSRISKVALSLVASIALAIFALPNGASAHEHREILSGQYEITIGFIDEPAFFGEKNGLYLKVEKVVAADPASIPAADIEGDGDEHEEGAGMLGLDETLQAEVIFGDQKMTLVLTPAFQNPGAYESIFFPMAAGDYTFHIFGDIEGNPIDESFTSSPEGFDSVQPREPFEFPKPVA